MIRILQGDCRQHLRTIKDNSINCVATSPPYWGLRDYGGEPQQWDGWTGHFGLEPTYQMYVDHSVEISSHVHRILKPDGTFWLNLGDSYVGGGRGGNPAESKHRKQATNTGSVIGVTKQKWPVPADLKHKDLVGIPWRVAFALQSHGWYLRSAIIWAKPNGMPGSQQDRPTSSYETVFMFSKSPRYWSDFDAIKTPPKESTRVRLAQDVQAQAGSHRANAGAKTNGPMRAVTEKIDKQRGHSRRHAGFNERWDAMSKEEQQARPAMMRDVWFIPPQGFKDAHFATFPEELARRMILAGCPESGIVLDPFAGSGTVGVVANALNRHAILIEQKPEYVEMIRRRCFPPLQQAAE